MYHYYTKLNILKINAKNKKSHATVVIITL